MRTSYSQFVEEHLQGTASLLCGQFCKSVLQPHKPPHDQVSEPDSFKPSLALCVVTSTWVDVLCALPVPQGLQDGQQLHPRFLPSPPFKCMLLIHACTAPIPTPAWANTHDRSGTPSGSNPSNSPVPGTRPKTSAASSNPYAPLTSRQGSPAAGGGGARVGAGAGSGGTAAAARSPQDAAAPGSAGAGAAGTSDAQVLRTAGSSWPVRAPEV